MKNPSDKYPIVYLEWVDAYGSNEWLTEEEVDDIHLDRNKITVWNIGWLLRKDKDVYVISPMLNPGRPQWTHVETIPKQWAKLEILAPPKKKK